MNPFTVVLRVGLCLTALLPAGGTAFADGAPGLTTASAPAGQDRVIERVVFRCQGGVRVQVTRMPNRARIEFAGQTRTLDLADGVNGVRYRSGGFAWVNDGKVASMQNTRSGAQPVSGCVRVN
ncbi:MliC family protein [Deinococcus aestuarii]|uniref:MliC family protein n=1 Tax=Deinococcus aestuarii TaxID=2774531 RepID=UPI001C0D0B5C